MSIFARGEIALINANTLFERLGKSRTQPVLSRDQPFWRAVGSFLVILSLLALGTFVQLYLTWVTGDWSFYLFNIGLASLIIGGIGGIFAILWPISVGVSNLRSPAYLSRRNQTAAQAQRALLAALKAPDDVLLPMTPFTAATPTLPLRRQHTGPLFNFKSVPSATNLWLSIALLLYTLLAISQLIVFSLRGVFQSTAQTYADFRVTFDKDTQFLFILMGFSYIGLFAVIFASYRAKNRHIQIDEDGLQRPHYNKLIRLSWSDVRTIGYYYHTPYSFNATGYVIASEDALLTWGVDELHSSGSARNIAAAQQLLSLAITRTGLPLRDITPLVQSLASKIPQPPRHSRQRSAAVNTRPSLSKDGRKRASTLFAAAQAPLPSARRISMVLAVALLIGLCVIPYLTVIIVHDKVLPGYLATLPAQLQKQTPFYQDSLKQPDSIWPTQVADEIHFDTIAFANGSYAITNGGGQGLALLPPVYHAVAIQVTMRMPATAPAPDTSYEIAGAGIVFRARANSAFYTSSCAFLISMSGDWQDTCSYEAGAVIGHSVFIHTGVNAVNTLLVIVRGQFAAFYINNHYLGNFFDGSDAPLGQIGLTSQMINTAVSFTNFTVWSVKPPLNVAYV